MAKDDLREGHVGFAGPVLKTEHQRADRKSGSGAHIGPPLDARLALVVLDNDRSQKVQDALTVFDRAVAAPDSDLVPSQDEPPQLFLLGFCDRTLDLERESESLPEPVVCPLIR